MLSVALVHWPCVDKNGDTVATSITNLDLHDLARLCLTYSINKLYIVHPYKSQIEFAEKIMKHWLEGYGGGYNPLRKKAFEVVRLIESIEALKAETGALLIATTARTVDRAISLNDIRKLKEEKDVCLLFGTGSGLASEIIKEADEVAEPIEGQGDYNHLSVRTAAAIILDRLLGR